MVTDDTTLYAHWSVAGGGNGNGSGIGDGNDGSTGSGGVFWSGDGSSAAGGSARVAKSVIPASAFTWDGRTLTVRHDGITPPGLLSVQWDGAEMKEYSVHQGSVIIRFYQDFTDSQTSGAHTVRVEFLNHIGETTVVLTAGINTESAGFTGNSDTRHPGTGGDDLHNPQTGKFVKAGTETADRPQ